MALAMALGALGTHTLKGVLSADHYGVFQTAVLYQVLNALGLLFVGVRLAQGVDRVLSIAGDLLLAGVLLFSGSLYAWLCGAPHAIGVLTPLGGLCLIAAWFMVALALLRAPPPPGP